MAQSSSSFRRRFSRAAGLAAAGLLVVTAQAAADDGQILRENAANAIPESYIVVFEEDDASRSEVRSEIASLAAEHDADVQHRYLNTIQGFSATMSREDALALSTDPAVDYVQQNRTYSALETQTPTPSWGLDRIDQRDLPLSNAFTYPNAGAGVTAYIIDTGIRTTHSAFGGRATWGTNTTGDGNNSDCNGHGTHVAGTVGGSQYGVAKGVTLKAVKVLNCSGSGTSAGVAAGIDWVTGNHVSGPAVANMSLGGSGTDTVIENAVRNSIADGVVYAIASGNSGADACNFTPARVTQAITVNATTNTDARASYSNYGTCTDLFAPGSAITSAWHTGDTATNTINGTSMATPHVAGAAALVLAANPAFTPAQVADNLIAASTPNKVTSPGTGSPNRLLFVANGVTPGPTPTPTPSPTPTPTPAPTGCTPAPNGTDIAVPDLGTAESALTIAGCAGNASATAKVDVSINHTYIGDLVVDLIAPDGSVYNLHNRAGGSADNINQTYTVNLSSEPANGTWKLRVRDAASADTGSINAFGLNLGAAAPACAPATNATDVTVPDLSTVESAITVAGCPGNAKATSTVEVHIVHGYRGDLVVTLVAPDGSTYVLHNRAGGSADNLDQVYTVNLSSEVANGTWKLRVQDAAAADTGFINSWTITP